MCETRIRTNGNGKGAARVEQGAHAGVACLSIENVGVSFGMLVAKDHNLV